MPTPQSHVQHLYLQAGFGIDLPGLRAHMQKSPSQLIEDLFDDARFWHSLEVPNFEMPDLMTIRQMKEEERREMQQQARRALGTLNLAWLNQMASGRARLREKMALFWHDHFVTRHQHAYAAQLQVNTLREHALGKFGTLLSRVAKDPAMLRFLNNQQNHKAHPNENFARELLELFTLGRGYYTEQDIQQAARAFTGWSSLPNGEFVFRPRWHDYGTKTFLGRRGNFDGDDILHIILEQERTASFITRKLYRFFVNPDVDKEVVSNWAKEFYESDYDLSTLMRRMLSSDHFFEARHIGTRIKSPIEYLLNLMCMLNMRFEQEEGAIMLQRLLGQVLLQPPSVAGWPQERAWIDSNSMMLRLKIPQALIFSSGLEVQPKAAFAGNEDAIRAGREMKRRLGAKIDWQPLLSELRGLEEEQILASLASWLYQLNTDPASYQWMRQHLPPSGKDERIKWMCMRLMGTPEFQLM
ncbi:MAG: DUF1800 domain-containing protein [Bacteroidetes bacterium]|nr:MAG: DUF1800 domain-containing protein [Bacteroidota bacterium]